MEALVRFKAPSGSADTKPSARLVAHDIRLRAELRADGSKVVEALVECERRGCEVSASVCARCPRFARIEPHEAGYVLLCHSEDVSSAYRPYEPAQRCWRERDPSDE